MQLSDLPKPTQKAIEALLLCDNFPAAKALYDQKQREMLAKNTKEASSAMLNYGEPA